MNFPKKKKNLIKVAADGIGSSAAWQSALRAVVRPMKKRRPWDLCVEISDRPLFDRVVPESQARCLALKYCRGSASEADYRYDLFATHVSYFHYLKDIGKTLRRFVDEELAAASSLCLSSIYYPSLICLSHECFVY
ncbi:unnamed protein product [Cuscuta epithymum]|uniref:DUF630 domain-containing protein n=1 Tax=Cuscuta epithymum TaxID=186058 RepID=A0AAV0FG95_9ASTE|nr:unnamed protein product [Cuscuta epithymum]